MNEDRGILVAVVIVISAILLTIFGYAVYYTQARIACVQVLKDKPPVEIQAVCGRLS